jgi:hypothetical protein
MAPQSKDMWIDGVLYSCIALFGFLQAYFTSEESYKYVNPYVLFWIKGAVGSAGAVAGALKMFRSTTFADHQKESKTNQENKTP